MGRRGGQQAVNAGNTFYSVKRLIGQDYEAVEEEVQRLAYTVTADEDGFVALDCPNSEGGRLYPEEVSAYVLAKLLSAAKDYLGGRPVSKAVISVPAYFDDAQREATITAGRIAGLETVRIIREPVAAALAYGLDVQEDQTVLVLDLGGGTYDVGGGVIEVLSTGGDPHLGGDDWDAAIMQWLMQEHLAPRGVDGKDPRVLANLRAVSEAAKVALSSREKVVIRMPVGGGIEAPLTRQAFEGLTTQLFRRARLPLDQACWQAGVDLGTAVRDFEEQQRRSGGGSKAKRKGGRKSTVAAAAAAAGAALEAGDVEVEGVQIRPKRRQPVSRVLLVGGATRMPAVRRFVRHMTGLEAEEDIVDPDLAVALGAAVQAGIYQGQVADLMVMDVWQASLMRALAQHMEQQRQAQQGEGPGQPRYSAGEGRLARCVAEGEEGGSEAEEEDWGPEGELE
ncbi:hypothetical protein N2152v2_007713 [Parachlorella kessleri]